MSQNHDHKQSNQAVTKMNRNNLCFAYLQVLIHEPCAMTTEVNKLWHFWKQTCYGNGKSPNGALCASTSSEHSQDSPVTSCQSFRDLHHGKLTFPSKQHSLLTKPTAEQVIKSPEHTLCQAEFKVQRIRIRQTSKAQVPHIRSDSSQWQHQNSTLLI